MAKTHVRQGLFLCVRGAAGAGRRCFKGSDKQSDKQSGYSSDGPNPRWAIVMRRGLEAEFAPQKIKGSTQRAGNTLCESALRGRVGLTQNEIWQDVMALLESMPTTICTELQLQKRPHRIQQSDVQKHATMKPEGSQCRDIITDRLYGLDFYGT
jgi:hypothetical protein